MSVATGAATAKQALKGQQLRGREPLHPQPAVMADPDGPLLEEPVGRLLSLAERLVSARGDREALGQGVDHVGAGEGGRLSGQSVRAGQHVQRGVQLCPRRWTSPSARADLGELALAHPLLSQFGPPPGIDALLRFGLVLGCPGRDRGRAGRLNAGQAVGVQPVVDLLRALAEPLDQCPVVQPLDLGRAGARIHRPPADAQAWVSAARSAARYR
jgi:hypothetical protein